MGSKAGLGITVPMRPLPGFFPGEPSRWGMGTSPPQSPSASGTRVKLALWGSRHQDGLCQACGLPVPAGQLPAVRAPLVLLNCCSWFRSATRALATCFPLSSCCLSPNHRPYPHPPIPMLLLGPWKLQDATFPHPSRGTDSPWICLWPPEPSEAAATCLGRTPPDCTLEA